MEWREFQSLQRVMELGDRFISYVDEGSGPPLVLLHGVPTWGFLWEGLLANLSRDFRVLIPDLLGFGFSDKSDRFDRALDKQTVALDAWIERLGVHPLAFVGHDLGGGIALRMATHYPHRVSSLCLINSVCYDSWPLEMMLQFGHPGVDRVFSAPTAVRVLGRILKGGFYTDPEDRVMDGLLVPYATEVGKLSLIRNATSLNTNLTTQLTSALPSISAPTHLIWGAEDRFQPIHYAHRLIHDIPTSELTRVEEARHYVMFDRPEKVLRVLRGFLGVKREAVAA